MIDLSAPGWEELPAPRLPLSRYRFRFLERSGDDRSSLARAGYLGSAWRGAFGHALRRAVCVTRLPACDSCILLRSCVYPWLFESRTPPNAAKLSRYPRTPGPFVLEPSDPSHDAAAETLNLGVVLFGQANDQLPYVAHALEQVGRGGLTAKRIKLDLRDVQVEVRIQDGTAANETLVSKDGWSTVYVPGGQLAATPTQPLLTPKFPGAVRVRLLSPMRIRRDNRLVDQRAFDFRSLAGVLLRRISLLTTFFGDTPLETDFAGLLSQADSLPIAQRQLHWREWTRYSSRQEAKLQMGGLVGWFEVEGSGLESLWPYLWLGQWTHVGKGCSMGLGRYVLEPVGGSREQAGDRAESGLKADTKNTARRGSVGWASPLQL